MWLEADKNEQNRHSSYDVQIYNLMGDIMIIKEIRKVGYAAEVRRNQMQFYIINDDLN